MKKVMSVLCFGLLLVFGGRSWAAPNYRLSWTGGESWVLTCSYGCGNHTDVQNTYHAMDFDKPGIPEGDCTRIETIQPVVAPAAGTVTFAADNGGFGYSVKIDAGGGYVIMLSHMCPTLIVQVGRYVLPESRLVG